MAVLSLAADKKINWTKGVGSGVRGGIASKNAGRVVVDVVADYGLDTTGTTDVSGTISAIVDAITVPTILYFSIGDFLLLFPISCPANRASFVTFRGAGPDDTRFWQQTGYSGAIQAGTAGGFINYVQVTNSPAKGGFTLVVSDASGLSAGKLIKISIDDDIGVPVFHVAGFKRRQTQICRITNVAGTTLTLESELNFALPSMRNPGITVEQYGHLEAFGVEDLTIDCTNSVGGAYAIEIYQSYNCWVKNCRLINTPNYLLHVEEGLNFELRDSFLSNRTVADGPNGYALGIYTLSGFLIENNIIYDLFPNLETNRGCSGVVAYNFFYKSESGGVIGGTANGNHDPHPYMILWEGNCISRFQIDGYEGSSNNQVLVRNFIHGKSPTSTASARCITLNRLTRAVTLWGNIVGNASRGDWVFDNDFSVNAGQIFDDLIPYCYSIGLPNIGNGGATGSSELSTGDEDPDWGSTGTLTTRTSNTVGAVTISNGSFFNGQIMALVFADGTRVQGIAGTQVGIVVPFTADGGSPVLPALSSTCEVFMGPNGYQTYDFDVRNTTDFKENYDYATHSVPAEQSIGSDTVPTSLFYPEGETPDWWPEDMVFPPYDSRSLSTHSFDSLPAGRRFQGGAAPPEIVTPATGRAYAGEAFSFTIDASPPATGFTWDGEIPPWALLNAETGEITGTPNEESVYTINLHATNGLGTGNQTFILTARGLRRGRITCLRLGSCHPVVFTSPFSVENEHDGSDG